MFPVDLVSVSRTAGYAGAEMTSFENGMPMEVDVFFAVEIAFLTANLAFSISGSACLR